MVGKILDVVGSGSGPAPPSVSGSVGGLPSKVNGLAPGEEECFLAVKSAKPCSPLRSDTHAA